MRLGTKTRYGTRAMLDPALHYERGLASVREMAHRQQVSQVPGMPLALASRRWPREKCSRGIERVCAHQINLR